MSLSEPFIRRPVATVLVAFTVLLFGLWARRTLPVSDMPDVDYPVIMVTTQWPGADPTIMASNVAAPLEQQFLQIQGLQELVSTNTFGFSKIIMIFDLKTSIDGIGADVEAAISRAQPNLPKNLPGPPSYQKANPNELPMYYLGLASTSLTQAQLYDYAFTQVSQRISVLDGVSTVTIYGSPRAVRIKVDLDRLYGLGLQFSDVTNAVKHGTNLTAAGTIYGQEDAFLLLPQTQLSEAAQYGDLIIEYRDESPVRLRDVAEAVEGIQNQYFVMDFWARAGLPAAAGESDFAAVVLGISKAGGSNAVRVVEEIEAALAEIEPTLPGSIQVVPIYDKSVQILESVHDVQTTLLIAFVLVVGVIFLFLGRVKDTLIPSVALPLSICATFVAMSILGYSLDNLSLLALTLSIGFLVDDAVVFLENTVRRMQRFGESPPIAARESAREISFTILSMTLSLAAVFIPLVFMPGLLGRIFREFSVTIVVAILMSGLVSLTVTPMMCARVLGMRRKGDETWLEARANQIEGRVVRWYGSVLEWFLDRKWVSVTIWIVCLLGTVWLFKALPKTFLPLGDSGLIQGVWLTDSSTSPDRMRQYQHQIDGVLRAHPAVELYLTATGIPKQLSEPQGLIVAFLRDLDEKYTDPKTGRTRTRPGIEVVNAELLAQLDEIPGIVPLIRPQPTMVIGGSGAVSTNQGQYAYTLAGVDESELFRAAQELERTMLEQKGKLFATVSSDLFLDDTHLRLILDRDRASMMGITAGDFSTVLYDAFSQNYSYLIKTPVEQYQVIVEAADRFRRRPTDLDLLYFRPHTAGGPSQPQGQTLPRLVPLSEIALLETGTGPLEVHHTGGIASVTLFFDTAADVSIGEASTWMEQKAAAIIPKDIAHGFTGSAQTFEQTGQALVLLLFVAIFVMYVIMGILYESYIHPWTVLLSLPTATVGGLLGLWLFGLTVSFYVYVGMFMLIGIVKKNAIMMVDFSIQRRQEGRAPREAIHDAALERFRPIMMTTVAAVMGALPIALGFGADAASRIPLGVTVVCGLILAQLLTLFVTPVTYLLLEWVQVNLLDRVGFFARGDVLQTEEPHA